MKLIRVESNSMEETYARRIEDGTNLARKIKEFKKAVMPGQILTIKRKLKSLGGPDRSIIETKHVMVVQKFENHVLCQNIDGYPYKESFQWIDAYKGRRRNGITEGEV